MLSNCIKRDPRCPVCLFAVSAMLLLLATCCSKDVSSAQQNDADEITSQEVMQIVPLEDALKTLGTFMAEIDPDAATTKGGLTKEIANIETHYSDEVLTKSGDPVPDAYVINFTDDGGFAVLGANTSVVPVVACSESGSFSNAQLDEYYASVNNIRDDQVFDEEGFPLMATRYDVAVAAIATTIERQDVTSSSTTNEGHNNQDYVLPLVKTQWNQGYYDYVDEDFPENKYCCWGGINVYAGCSVISLAQVMAYNKCPDPAIDYSNISRSGLLRDETDPAKMDYTQRFIGNIFDHIILQANSGGSSSSAGEQRKYLSYMDGYYNVYKTFHNSFTEEMTQTAKGMIKEGKPVIVSALHTISSGHSWVLDGYKYYDGRLYFHCNWGWGGEYNGYYSSSWFCVTADDAKYDNPQKALEALESLKKEGKNPPGDYNWWCTIITYDL